MSALENSTKINFKQIYEELYPYRSSYIDTNGLLKESILEVSKLDDFGNNGEIHYKIFYQGSYTIINEYGYFYDIFSCKKYDSVILLSEDLYICKKNERVGLLDKNENNILHVSYKKISRVNTELFIVTTETGKFLFNLYNRKQSNVFDDIIVKSEEMLFNHPYLKYFIFKTGNKYGLLDEEGNILLNPEYNLGSENKLLYSYQGISFHVSIEKGAYFGKIPIKEYDTCFKVGHDIMAEFYITKRNQKYGLLNWKAECVSKPIFDEILLYKEKYRVKVNRYTSYVTNGNRFKTSIDTILVICRSNNSYSLFELQDCKEVLSGCDNINYKETFDGDIIIEFSKGVISGYVTVSGTIISTKEFDDIQVVRNSFIVKKNGKFGVLTGIGSEMAPCIYDSVTCDKKGIFIGTKKQKDSILNPRPESYYDDIDDDDSCRPVYGRYSGSYAQDEAGWSDDDIDTVLEGDPDAYWNID